MKSFSRLKWEASLPSNIAIIKYMGKRTIQRGLKEPLNSSLSLTLPYLRSKVELELKWERESFEKNGIRRAHQKKNQAKENKKNIKKEVFHLKEGLNLEKKENFLDHWEPLEGDSRFSFYLSSFERNRFLEHLKFLKNKFHFKGNLVVRSKNNFPLGLGIASSASSFSSLTAAFAHMMSDFRRAFKRGKNKKGKNFQLNQRDFKWENLDPKYFHHKKAFHLDDLKKSEIKNLSQYSGRASGSSARSFFSPWCLMDQKKGAMECVGLPVLHHMVVVVEDGKKLISSSLAHELVLTSALFKGRPERAEARLKNFLKILRNHKWEEAFFLSWAEFWDMQALFETSQKPFGYFTEDSIKVLNFIRKIWAERKEGPLVTMDAGSSVHFLFRRDQKELGKKIFLDLKKKFLVLCDPFFLS